MKSIQTNFKFTKNFNNNKPKQPVVDHSIKYFEKKEKSIELLGHSYLANLVKNEAKRSKSYVYYEPQIVQKIIKNDTIYYKFAPDAIGKSVFVRGKPPIKGTLDTSRHQYVSCDFLRRLQFDDGVKDGTPNRYTSVTDLAYDLSYYSAAFVHSNDENNKELFYNALPFAYIIYIYSICVGQTLTVEDIWNKIVNYAEEYSYDKENRNTDTYKIAVDIYKKLQYYIPDKYYWEGESCTGLYYYLFDEPSPNESYDMIEKDINDYIEDITYIASFPNPTIEMMKWKTNTTKWNYEDHIDFNKFMKKSYRLISLLNEFNEDQLIAILNKINLLIGDPEYQPIFIIICEKLQEAFNYIDNLEYYYLTVAQEYIINMLKIVKKNDNIYNNVIMSMNYLTKDEKLAIKKLLYPKNIDNDLYEIIPKLNNEQLEELNTIINEDYLN